MAKVGEGNPFITRTTALKVDARVVMLITSRHATLQTAVIAVILVMKLSDVYVGSIRDGKQKSRRINSFCKPLEK